MSDDGRVVSNFIIQALKGEPLTVYGEGTQTRSFCYVDNMVDGLLRLMNYEGENAHLPINLGNPNEFTIMQLANKVLELTGSNSTIRKRKLPSDDPKQRQPDIRRAKQYLDWEPTIQLEEGLKPTIAYFQRVLRQKAWLSTYEEDIYCLVKI